MISPLGKSKAEKADNLLFLSLANTYLISCDPPVHYCINFHYSLTQTGTFPITQVIQNTGGTGGGVTAPGATAAAIQTVKIGGQQVGIPRTMTTTTLTPQQLQQLSASGGRAGGQVLSAASIQNALRFSHLHLSTTSFQRFFMITS